MPEELEKLLAEKPTDNLYRKLAVYLTSHTDYDFETYVRCVRFIGEFARCMTRRFSHKKRETVLRRFPEVQNALESGLTIRDVMTIVHTYGSSNLVLPKCPSCGREYHAFSCGNLRFANACNKSCSRKLTDKFNNSLSQLYGDYYNFYSDSDRKGKRVRIDLEKMLSKDSHTDDDLRLIAKHLRDNQDYNFETFVKSWALAIRLERVGSALLRKQREKILSRFPEVQDALTRGLYMQDILTIVQLGSTNLTLPKCPVCGKEYHAQRGLNLWFAKTCSRACGRKIIGDKFGDTMLEQYGRNNLLQTDRFTRNCNGRKVRINLAELLSKDSFSRNDLKLIARHLRDNDDYDFDTFAKCWLLLKPIHKAIAFIISPKRRDKILQSFSEVQNALSRGLTLHDIKALLTLGKKELVLPKCPVCEKDIHVQKKDTNYFAATCSVSCGQILCEGKRQDTIERLYGVKHALQSKELIDKLQATLLKNFGVTNARLSPEIVAKTSASRLDTSYERLLNLSEVEPMFTRKEWQGCSCYPCIDYVWMCKKCGSVFSSPYRFPFPKCLKCYPPTHGSSNFQKDIAGYIKDNITPQIRERDRQLIRPLELDIVAHEKNVAIEVNGIYWHSVKKKTKGYHLQKTKLCEKANVKLIHLFEDDWYSDKQSAVINRLRTLLANDKVYYARKCQLRDVGMDDATMFLDEYHTQGNSDSIVRLGLYYDNKLVALMTFGKPQDEGYDWELQRYCSHGRVQGGASKLYKYFLASYRPRSVVSYADRNWSTGFGFYNVLGLEKTKTFRPKPFFVHKLGDSYFSIRKPSKRVVKNLLGKKYNKSLSGEANLLNNFFLKIYDCGAYEFSKVYNLPTETNHDQKGNTKQTQG